MSLKPVGFAINCNWPKLLEPFCTLFRLPSRKTKQPNPIPFYVLEQLSGDRQLAKRISDSNSGKLQPLPESHN